ncbi:FCGBP protein, partial [Centropus unirufus]|nr:FCGBP protein [Centropus unirufus]
LRTNFSLTVSFDGQSHLVITVPTSYSGALCGLCGDFDGDPHNDVPTALASTPGCEEPPPHPCPRLDIITRKQRATREDCGILLWPEGPFRSCHSVVDPESFFQACVTDYCVFRGHKAMVCQAMASYATACQEAGVVLEHWRSKNTCAPACPAGSHYELNGTSCPATCGPPTPQDLCDLPRLEGCFCDQGLLLSGDRCVPPHACGCHHHGRYHQQGEDFYPEDGCDQRCRCLEEDTVTCWSSPCPPGLGCRVENGVRGCHGGQRGRCVLLGNQSLVTFDGLKVNLGGSCRYLLAKVCHGGGGHQLEVTLEDDGGVTVVVEGTRVTMRNGVTWAVDGENLTLPLSIHEEKTWVVQEGNNIVLHTALGHRVVYAAAVVLLVTIPTASAGQMCGLCGDFDGHQDNDFTGPNGNRVKGIQDLLVAWKDQSIPCSDTCRTCGVPPVDATRPYQEKTSCGLMVAAPGPFSRCHGQVGPERFLDHCLQEMVLTAGAPEALCRSLQAYTAACQEAGAVVETWRNQTFCPLACGDHSFYSLCARSCQGGCAHLGHQVLCSSSCFEGCSCSQGFFSHGHRCVLPSTCGC